MKYMNTIREHMKGGLKKIVFIQFIYIIFIVCRCLGCFLNSKVNSSGHHVVKEMLCQ
jgi:hypothetical protein